MPSGKQILEDLAALLAKHSAPDEQEEAEEGEMPMAKKMAQQADPAKREKAAQSLSVAFGDKK